MTMKAVDAGAIAPQLCPADEAAQAKSRAYDCAKQVFDAFEIRLERVDLKLDEAGNCRARAAFQKDSAGRTLDVPVSDALALAARTGAVVYADEAVLQQGKVSEEGLDCPFEEGLEAMEAELLRNRPRTELLGMGFEIGLAPEDGREILRLRKDEAADALHLEVDGSEEDGLTLGLLEHGRGVERLWQMAQNAEHGGGLLHDGKEYRTHLDVEGDELMIRFEPKAGGRGT